MLLTCWNNFTKLRLGRLDRLDRLGWCRAGALGAPLAQSLPRRETTAVCFCPGTYPIWALKILINMWYKRNMNMSNICQIYVIIEVHTHHFFTIYTQSHKYISVSMLSSLTHPPSKSTLRICGTSVDSPIHDMVSVCVGVIPVAHEAKMLYCITDTVRRTSFWTPSRACRRKKQTGRNQ